MRKREEERKRYDTAVRSRAWKSEPEGRKDRRRRSKQEYRAREKGSKRTRRKGRKERRVKERGGHRSERKERRNEGEEEVEKVRMRGDLSDHVAGANGVSNGVDQSLPALKHERAGCPVPLSLLPLPRANAYSNNEPSIIVGIIIIAGPAVLVLLRRLAGFSSFLSLPRQGRIYTEI